MMYENNILQEFWYDLFTVNTMPLSVCLYFIYNIYTKAKEAAVGIDVPVHLP